MWSGWGALRWRPIGAREALKTGLEGSWPAESHDAAGLGEVPKYYPQPAGTRPFFCVWMIFLPHGVQAPFVDETTHALAQALPGLVLRGDRQTEFACNIGPA